MKTLKKLKAVVLVITLFNMNSVFAQEIKSNTKEKITVLNIDTKGIAIDPTLMGSMVRVELEKLGIYEVMDQYDVNYAIEKNKININNCYGKMCLVEVGKLINSNKMFTGSAELFGESLTITLRLIDVKSETIEKTQVMEFLNLPKEMQNMIGITLAKMYNQEVNQSTLGQLTKKTNFENTINTPNVNRLRLDGPRMGFTMFTGETAKVIRAKSSEGGFDAVPVMFQFGYQFEKQYLNSGNVQALFEVVPMITGLDQGMFIPSLTFMHGLRLNKGGWEFAFGPTFNITRSIEGSYDANGKWFTKADYFDTYKEYPTDVTSRLDSRGDGHLRSQFVLAFGKSFKSGKLNVPFNGFIIPSKSGVRVGFSFGFNGKNKA